MSSSTQNVVPTTRNWVATGGVDRWRGTRSVVARLLLLVLGGMFLLPLLPLEAVQAGLTACCKKEGKHFCAAPASLKSTGAVPQGRSLSERCPYSFRHALTGIVPALYPTRATIVCIAQIQYRSGQTSAHPTPFAPERRANPKRGPPHQPFAIQLA